MLTYSYKYWTYWGGGDTSVTVLKLFQIL